MTSYFFESSNVFNLLKHVFIKNIFFDGVATPPRSHRFWLLSLSQDRGAEERRELPRFGREDLLQAGRLWETMKGGQARFGFGRFLFFWLVGDFFFGRKRWFERKIESKIALLKHFEADWRELEGPKSKE